jgi:3-phytase
VITEQTRYDTDDPAIWIDRAAPERSIVFGTDKETDGAIYAFDLEGKVIADKVIRGVRRPNNVDIEYGFELNGRSVDILAFSERESRALRLFSVPDMQPLDGGGFLVFEGEPAGEASWPMGLALYKEPATGAMYAIVGRKQGPTDGTYLWQYRLEADSTGAVSATRVRRFGRFSGEKEIEAIAVDDALGFVYYADEGVGIRKYYADPAKGDEELALFGTEGFRDDMEGIAVLATGPAQGFIIVSDQQGRAVRIFERTGEHAFVKSVPIQARETDGLEVSGVDFGGLFPRGLLVAMSDDRTFHYYGLDQFALQTEGTHNEEGSAEADR